jgi:predicted permease
LITGFGKLRKVDPGFRPENVLAYQMFLPRAKYEETNHRVTFIREHLERMRAIPGVEVVGAASLAPLGGHDGWFFEIEGAPPLGPDEKNPVVLHRSVMPGYFRALGITLLGGRVFNERDGLEEKNPVVIINETFAKRFFPEVDPVGKRIRYPGDKNPWMTVIGVAKDVKHYGLDNEMRPGVYVPYSQMTTPYLTVVARTLTDPLSLVTPARRAVREVDAEIPLYDVTTMSQRLDESLWGSRTASWFFVTFAAVALLLASAGIYGVISYSVNRRAREISIRMALGASPGRVLGRIMQQGLLLLVIGVALGLACAFMASRALSSLLFGVSPTDIGVYTTVTLLLAGIALVANLVPARRAAALDPMQNLRAE